MLIYREENSGQNHDRNSLKMWQNSNLWERLLRDQNCIHEDIKSRLNQNKTWYYSVQNCLPVLYVKLLKLIYTLV